MPEGYWLYEWYEECSQFTPGARWVAGTEYYAVRCRMWIPNSISGDNQTDLDDYIEANYDNPAAWANGEADGERDPGSP